MSDSDVHGPIDFLVIEFPAGADGAAAASAVRQLVDSATIRLYDVMVVAKATDGTCSEVDLSSPGEGQLGAFGEFAGARSGLLGPDDVLEATGLLDVGMNAVVLLYENAWAGPFVAAAVRDGGRMVATSRLTAQEIIDALDAADAAD